MIYMEARNTKGGKSEKDMDEKIMVQKCAAALIHLVL